MYRIYHYGITITRKEAKEQGLARYFDGDPCLRGHIEERKTSTNQCMACSRENSLRSYNKNPKKHLERNRIYCSTSEKRKIYRKQHTIKNREHRNLMSKKWHQKNRENQKLYKKERREKYSTHARNRRARIKNSPGHHTIEDIYEIMKAQKYRCAYCQKSIRKKYHVDHVTPIALGGTNERKNIQISCPECNLKKNKKDPLFWARLNGKLL